MPQNRKAEKQTIARLNLLEQDARRAREKSLRQLVAAVHDVRGHRRMTDPESPEQQDSWNRLQLAVLEAERTLQSPLDKRGR